MYSDFWEYININFKIQLQVISPYGLLNCQIVVKVNTSSVRAAHAFVGIFLILRLNLNSSNCNVWLSPSQNSQQWYVKPCQMPHPRSHVPSWHPVGQIRSTNVFCFVLKSGMCVYVFSHIRLFAIPWAVAR